MSGASDCECDVSLLFPLSRRPLVKVLPSAASVKVTVAAASSTGRARARPMPPPASASIEVSFILKAAASWLSDRVNNKFKRVCGVLRERQKVCGG